MCEKRNYKGVYDHRNAHFLIVVVLKCKYYLTAQKQRKQRKVQPVYLIRKYGVTNYEHNSRKGFNYTVSG